MKFRFPALAVVFSLFASSALAEMVVINGRYIVSKDSVRGYFYKKNDQQTAFDVRWDDWSTQYECNNEYDEAKVMAASLNFVIQLSESKSMDFSDFLDSEGFENCEKF